MSAVYSKTSPYYGTQTWGQYLDIWAGKTIPADVTDALYQIDAAYNGRPDLLSYDMYKDTSFWWVFAVRNPNTLIDPIADFTPGKIIYVPTYKVIKTALGL